MIGRLCLLYLMLTGYLVQASDDLTIYTEQHPPLSFTDDKGALSGFAVEVVQAIQKRINSNDKIELIPWARGYQYALSPSKKKIMLFSTAFTEERRELFKWVGPIAQFSWVFYARTDSRIEINSLQDARQVKGIGIYRGDVREQFLLAKGFTNIQSTTNNGQNLQKLLLKRITLWATSYNEAINFSKLENTNYQWIKPVYTFESTGLYMAFNKNTPDDIIDKWQQAYQAMKQDGTLASLAKKWQQEIPNHAIPFKK